MPLDLTRSLSLTGGVPYRDAPLPAVMFRRHGSILHGRDGTRARSIFV